MEGILYTIPDTDILKLDTFEGYPFHYTRQTITVLVQNSLPSDAVTYIAHPDQLQVGLLPHSDYLEHLLIGARVYLSTEYIDSLKHFSINSLVHRYL